MKRSKKQRQLLLANRVVADDTGFQHGVLACYASGDARSLLTFNHYTCISWACRDISEVAELVSGLSAGKLQLPSPRLYVPVADSLIVHRLRVTLWFVPESQHWVGRMPWS